MRTRRIIHGVVLFALVIARADLTAAKNAKVPSPLPPDAKAVIQEVAVSAGKKDLKALRVAMVENFTWSFGADRNADQAVEEWAKNPRYLRELQRVLRSGCHTTASDRIECPGRGDLSFRAGFTKIDGRWRMDYFVEGD